MRTRENHGVLLSKEKHRHVMEKANASTALTEANHDYDVLQSIRQPEQWEMSKRYHLTQNTLRDPGTDQADKAKMNKYRAAMNEFSNSRDRRGDARPAQPPRPSTNTSNDSNNNDGDSGDDVRAMDEKYAASVEVLPANQRKNAKRIVRNVRARMVTTLYRGRQNGDVSIREQRFRGTNIFDLVCNVLRSSRSSKTVSPQHDQFLTALVDANIPETVIKNNATLKHRV